MMVDFDSGILSSIVSSRRMVKFICAPKGQTLRPRGCRAGMLSVAALLTTVLLLPVTVFAQETPPTAAPPAVTVPASPVGGQPAATAATPAGATATAPPESASAATPPEAPGTVAPTPHQASGGMFEFLSGDDLSPWGMFMHADIVVKVVILGLIFASMVTWTIWLAKTIELTLAKRRLRRAYRLLRDASSLTLAAGNLGAGNGVARSLVREVGDEWRRSVEALDDRDGLKERIALHLERVEALTGRRMMVGTGILATIGSTAPFVGLFGTVWGIMNSFIGISKMHTTNLAVVAPGIAEALLATACGLIAAIPAVVIYNHFVRRIASYKALVANAASAVMALVSRDLSHGDHTIADVVRTDALRTPAEKPAGKSSLRLMTE